MGFLAPLYIAGLAAIALPIIFHLIRRSPQGKQQFSSLMFLSPSPPRLTKRSRLTNLLLLLLRASAFILLAFAFARPYLHHGPDLDLFKSAARRVVILVDTSASMRRGDLWKQAVAKADAVLADTTPADDVALLFFDNHTQTAVSFDEWRDADAGRRTAIAEGRLAAQQPTWNPTRLGDALATAADLASAASGAATEPAGGAPDKVIRQVVLISDLQQGSHVEALQGRPWPKGVLLDVESVSGKGSNASVERVEQEQAGAGESDGPAAKATGDLRVRVSNAADSKATHFTLAWATENGPVPTTQPATAVEVAPGRSVIVAVSRPAPVRGFEAGAADRLVLSGDDADFDNTLYVAPLQVETVRVVYLGGDDPSDPNALRYYLQEALANTPTRKVEFVAPPLNGPLPSGLLESARAVVVAAPLTGEQLQEVSAFVQAGHDALVVMKDVPTAQADAPLAGTEASVEESPTTGARAGNNAFALLGKVDFQNPLFAPFADARFADFTKIHFWHHRQVQLAEEGAGNGVAATGGKGHVLAAFDNGDPFLIERPLGKGRVRTLTAGWQPADSQLALSTKFVPLMEGMFRRADEGSGDALCTVGSAAPLPPADVGSAPADTAATRSVIAPDGKRIELPASATSFTPEQPGIYQIEGKTAAPLAVNLSADESRTAPMDPRDLERFGAVLGTGKPTTEQVSEERRLQTAELENRQKLWRWLILAVLGLLALETVLAGRLARRAQREQVAV
ncbi:MAG TPA: BatA domain-containing protein [Phycisphaerae bacterium]|nr:BatA domain-containing protein [Phycisphaerae bacterium]